MESFTLEITFHAENIEDAQNQARLALDGFDDGFQEAHLTSAKGTTQIHP